VGELAGAGALLSAFVVVQTRVSAPMLPLGLFRRRDFTAAQVAAFAISASFFALYLYMTLYLQDVLHLSAFRAGLVYMPGALLLFVVSAVSAQLSERVGPAMLVSTGLVLVAAGLTLVTIVGSRSAWTAVLPGDLVVCVGTGLFNPALAAVALAAGSPEDSGLLAGVNDVFRQGGIAVGVAAFGAIVPDAGALGHGAAGAYVSGLHEALFIGAALAAAGAVATVALIGARLRPHRAVPFHPSQPATEIA
jgi:predicted MFS family arabinose efflux permease